MMQKNDIDDKVLGEATLKRESLIKKKSETKDVKVDGEENW